MIKWQVVVDLQDNLTLANAISIKNNIKILVKDFSKSVDLKITQIKTTESDKCPEYARQMWLDTLR